MSGMGGGGGYSLSQGLGGVSKGRGCETGCKELQEGKE